MKELNLCFNGKFSKDQNLDFNNLAFKYTKEFIILIDSVSKNNNDNIDWWVSSPASRNIFQSPLFHYYCCFHLVNFYINKNIKINKIIVDSLAFKKILINYFEKKNIQINIYYKFKLNNYFLYKYIKLILIIIYYVYKLSICKLTKSFSKKQKINDLILIDTYVFSNFINSDRYYTGLLDKLDTSEKNNIYFVPTLVMLPFHKLYKVYQALRHSHRNFLIKEDYLNYKDLLLSIFFIIRSKKINVNKYLIFDQNFSLIIKEEINQLIGLSESVEAILSYKFIKNIKKLNLNVIKSINWFENQKVDKGWNFAINKFYPKIYSVGYRGIVPDELFLSQMYVTSIEEESNVLPKKIFVIGKGFVNKFKMYSPMTEVQVAPAFRFNHLWSTNNINHIYNNEIISLLVALPINFDDSTNILDITLKFININKNNRIRFYLKLHPTMKFKKINKFLGKNISRFILLDNDINQTKIVFDTIITGMSSIALETIAKGIPVVIINRTNWFHSKCIPDEINNDLWKSCYTEHDLLRTINQFKEINYDNSPLRDKTILEIKENYFEKISLQGIKRFLNLN